MADETKSIAKKTPEYYLENHFDQIKVALPRHIDSERMRRISLTELRLNSKLNQVANRNPLSFFGAVIQSAQLGLEPGAMAQCYFIPFGDEVKFIIGYQGMIELIGRSKKISSLTTGVVCEGEYFERAVTHEGELFRHVQDHDIEVRDESTIRLVYAIARMKDGSPPIIEVMSRTEINNNEKKNRKSANRNSTWNDYWDQMARKTVIRRIYKMLPKSIELSDYLSEEDADEGKGNLASLAKEKGLGNIIDIKAQDKHQKTTLGAKKLLEDIKAANAAKEEEERDEE